MSNGLKFASFTKFNTLRQKKLRNEFQIKPLYQQESVYLVQQLNYASPPPPPTTRSSYADVCGESAPTRQSAQSGVIKWYFGQVRVHNAHIRLRSLLLRTSDDDIPSLSSTGRAERTRNVLLERDLKFIIPSPFRWSSWYLVNQEVRRSQTLLHVCHSYETTTGVKNGCRP